MLQQQLLYIIAIYSSIHSICANCRVERIIMREPIEHDIGLIFDLSVSNQNTFQSQILQFTVNSNGICTLNLTNGKQVQAGTLFGGDYATIAAGQSATVSLVFPTESVYNRVGSCPIVIRSLNQQNELVDNQKKILVFDTRFEALDPNNQSLRRRQDFIDCKNWDKDYLNNCSPLDCEERYFGLLNFYNHETEHCEEPDETSTTKCTETTTVINEDATYSTNFYETTTVRNEDATRATNFFETTTSRNEVKTKTVKTKDRAKQPNEPEQPEQPEQPKQPKQPKRPKQSTIGFNIWELHPYGGLRRNHSRHQEIIFPSSGKSKMDQSNPSQLHHQDAKIETSARRKLKKKTSLTSELTKFYYAWYNVAPHEKDNWAKENNMALGSDVNNKDDQNGGPAWEELNESKTEEEEKTVDGTSGSRRLLHQLASYSGKDWLLMAMEALLLIMITFFIYAVVCVCLFGLLEIIVGMSTYKTTTLHIGKTLTPRHKKTRQELTTSASLMSVLK